MSLVSCCCSTPQNSLHCPLDPDPRHAGPAAGLRNHPLAVGRDGKCSPEAGCPDDGCDAAPQTDQPITSRPTPTRYLRHFDLLPWLSVNLARLHLRRARFGKSLFLWTDCLTTGEIYLLDGRSRKFSDQLPSLPRDTVMTPLVHATAAYRPTCFAAGSRDCTRTTAQRDKLVDCRYAAIHDHHFVSFFATWQPAFLRISLQVGCDRFQP